MTELIFSHLSKSTTSSFRTRYKETSSFLYKKLLAFLCMLENEKELEEVVDLEKEYRKLEA